MATLAKMTTDKRSASDNHVYVRAASRRDTLFELTLLLRNGILEPRRPPCRQPELPEDPSVGTQQGDKGNEYDEDNSQAATRRELSSHTQETGCADQHGNRSAEYHDLSVQADWACHNRAQTQ